MDWVDWAGGLDSWTGFVDWVSALGSWTGFVNWIRGLGSWTGLVDWDRGLGSWTGFADWVRGPGSWIGFVDRVHGLGSWIGLVDWDRGLGEWIGSLQTQEQVPDRTAGLLLNTAYALHFTFSFHLLSICVYLYIRLKLCTYAPIYRLCSLSINVSCFINIPQSQYTVHISIYLCTTLFIYLRYM